MQVVAFCTCRLEKLKSFMSLGSFISSLPWLALPSLGVRSEKKKKKRKEKRRVVFPVLYLSSWLLLAQSKLQHSYIVPPHATKQESEQT